VYCTEVLGMETQGNPKQRASAIGNSGFCGSLLIHNWNAGERNAWEANAVKGMAFQSNAVSQK